MIAALTPSSFISVLLNPPIIIIFALYCGVTIPPSQIPGFWRAWLYQLDPFTRLISGMVVTELQDLQVKCLPGEYNRFTAPPGETCGSYMQDFFARGGPGYLASNSTGNCEYCAYKTGQEFFPPLELNFNDRWRDLGIMAAFIASNLILLFIGTRFLNFNRR
jgi:ATP-binding cassette subfamily G (WHITE) protein 2 (SNQ2)